MLYHFQIELADVDRNIYQNLEFRMAQHPSENGAYLLSRALAYALSYQGGIEFSPAGLGDPESPALRVPGLHGAVDLWIEIGNPSHRKLHKASKAAGHVQVYTYKSADVLLQEIDENKVHRADQIQIFALDPKFLAALEKQLKKSNRWSLLHQQGQLDINTGDQLITGQVTRHR